MKIKIITALFLFLNILHPDFLHISAEELSDKKFYMDHYSWLTSDLYDLYWYHSVKSGVPIDLALAVVQAESKGRNVRSRPNTNGTRDYGRFQINSVHMQKNPDALRDDNINSYYGFYYLSKCLKKSEGNFSEAIRMYNQGLNGNKYKYKNWEYVEKVVQCYNYAIIKKMQ